MKKILLITVAVLIILTAAFSGGCIRRDISEMSSNTVTRDYDFRDFTRVEVEHAFKVDITQSDNYSISITAPENVADRLRVTKTGDTVKITLKYPVLFSFQTQPVAKITMPDLRGLSLAGATEGTVKGFKSSGDLDIGVSGASDLDIDMEAGNLKAEISGASGLNGYVKSVRSDLNLSGASDARLTGSGTDLTLICSGASNATINVKTRLDLDLSGASTLNYTGNPSLGKTAISGASDLNHKTP